MILPGSIESTVTSPMAAWDAVPLQSTLLESLGGIRHGITRRVVAERLAEANISFTAPRDEESAWTMRKIWCSAMGIDASTLVIPRQVHGSEVVVANSSHSGAGAAPGSELIADGDAIITDSPGIALMTTHADCLPMLLYSPEVGAIGAVHAGWRSTVSDVAGNTVSAMEASFGARPAGIHVYLGPAICASCYEVGPDVIDAWHALDRIDAAGAIRNSDGVATFDLVAANQALLERAGVCATRIDRTDRCTKCDGHEWFSHRGQGPLTGRFGSIIALDSCGR
jgi:purine-nucleoside/S-methyl-5'-thioadenosine phosphorylase / adenosine deaminase